MEFKMKTNQAFFRFYEELNDFLPAEKRKQTFEYHFSGAPSVKDAIEAIGVPHVEVDLVLVNGRSVDFSCRLADGDFISVYPVFESFDISEVTRLRSNPLRETRFLADVQLGTLAKYLRLSGFDTFYWNENIAGGIIELALTEKRVLLTRNIQLLKNKSVTHGYWVRSQKLAEQLREVITRFDLENQIHLFTRCLECNGLLAAVPKEEILTLLLPKTRLYYNDFMKCPGCGRIYWQGSHWERMKDSIRKMLEGGSPTPQGYE